MQRYEIINELIKFHGYKSYLEIGTQGDVCLSKVECAYKVGVDPEPVFHDKKNSDEFHVLPSDIFFQRNTDKFDCVFVDGLHEESQVKKDIANALKYLNPSGTIVVHDCNPQEEINQEYPMPHVGDWNGTVWRAWLWYRQVSTLSMCVVDTDQGIGIIRKGWQNPIKWNENITFEEFKKDRVNLLNLVPLQEWKSCIDV